MSGAPDSKDLDLPVYVDPKQYVIEDTTLADAHADASTFKKQLEEGATDMGEGFLQYDEPVVVDRGPDGSIVNVTPVSEHRAFIPREGDPYLESIRPAPTRLPRAEREKLVDVLTARLFKHYEGLHPDAPKFNPLYDGIPDLPSGSPEHLQPLPGSKLYPATRGQVYDWLRRFVADRAQVIEKRDSSGKGWVTDYALRFKTD